MKLFNIRLNDRIDHKVDFDSGKQKEENVIVELTPSSEVKLFSFSCDRGGNGYILQSDKGEKYCRIAGSIAATYSEEGNFVTISVPLEEVVKSAPVKSAGKKLPDEPKLRRAQKKEKVDEENIVADSAAEGDIIDIGGGLSLERRSEVGSCQDIFILSKFDMNQLYKIELVVTLRDRSRNVIYHLASRDRIEEVVLDFGSEASQMAIFNRDKDMTIHGIVDIFDELKSSYKGIEKDDKYVQWGGNRQLYLSKFFIKKEIEEAVENPSLALSNAPGDKMRILTTENEIDEVEFRNSYMQSPNIKLINFGGVDLPKLKLVRGDNTRRAIGINEYSNNYFYRAAVNLFLREAAKRISGGKLVSFRILMPNVYTQRDIVENLGHIYEDIRMMLDEDSFKENILGFELSAVSESDASILGVISAGKLTNEGTYLILDAGKGTLDYSLLSANRVNKRWQYVNYVRSGIIGAGNAITYGYFISLLKIFLKYKFKGELTDDLLKEYIYTNILGKGGSEAVGAGDSANFYKMMSLVDKYKIAESGEMERAATKEEKARNGQQGGTTTGDLGSIQLSTFLDFLKGRMDGENRIIYGDENFDDVEKMVDSLAIETCNNINGMMEGAQKSVNYIIFAGRGFKHRAFSSKMAESMMGKFQSAQVLPGEVEALTLKNICLYCCNPLKNGEYNPKVMSYPFLIREKGASPESGKTGKGEKKNSSSGFGSFFAGVAEKFGLGQKADKSEKDNLQMLQGLRNTVTYFLEGDQPKSFTPEKKAELQSDGNRLGYTINIGNPLKDKLNFGGRIYTIPNGVGKESVEIFFDGKDYIIRTSGNEVVVFDNQVNVRSSKFEFASFFPYCEASNLNEVILVPEIGLKGAGRGESDSAAKTAGAKGSSAGSEDVENKGGGANDEEEQLDKDLESIL